jgi:hypothetical protein
VRPRLNTRWMVLTPVTWLVACSCAGTWPHGIASEDLLRFLPDDVRSLVVVTPSVEYPRLPWAHEGIKACVIGGRGFKSRGASMEGDCEAVWVWESLPDGPPSWWIDLCKAAEQQDDIAGYPTYCFQKLHWGPREDWFAIVDNTYLVRASRKWLLEDALERNGHPMGNRLKLWGLPARSVRPAPIAMIRLKDDSPSWPTGLQAFVLTGPVGTDFWLRARTSEFETFRDWLRGFGVEVVGQRLDEGCRMFRICNKHALDSVELDILLHRLFGFHVFI